MPNHRSPWGNFLAQVPDMLAQSGRMPAHCLLLFLGCLRVHGLLPCDEIDLAVYDDPALVRQSAHDVRMQASAVLIDRFLLSVVMLAFLQAGAAQDAFEHELTPITADFRVSLQRAREGLGVTSHVLVE